MYLVHLLIIIIRLLESVWVLPKVILLSGIYCITFLAQSTCWVIAGHNLPLKFFFMQCCCHTVSGIGMNDNWLKVPVGSIPVWLDPPPVTHLPNHSNEIFPFAFVFLKHRDNSIKLTCLTCLAYLICLTCHLIS